MRNRPVCLLVRGGGGRSRTATARSHPDATHRATSRRSRLTPNRARRTASPHAPFAPGPRSVRRRPIRRHRSQPVEQRSTAAPTSQSGAARTCVEEACRVPTAWAAHSRAADRPFALLTCGHHDHSRQRPSNAPDEPLKDRGRTAERSERTGERTIVPHQPRTINTSTVTAPSRCHGNPAVTRVWAALRGRSVWSRRGRRGGRRRSGPGRAGQGAEAVC